MQWRVMEQQGRYLVCRKTWHSADWMGIEKKDIREVEGRGRTLTVEVFAECGNIELARKLLQLKQPPPGPPNIP